MRWIYDDSYLDEIDIVEHNMIGLGGYVILYYVMLCYVVVWCGVVCMIILL